jgi:hypothetical protein
VRPSLLQRDAGHPKRGCDQLCVAVLGQLAQLPVGEAADVAVGVVVWRAGLGGDVAAALDDYVVALGDKAIRGVRVPIRELREERPD